MGGSDLGSRNGREPENVVVEEKQEEEASTDQRLGLPKELSFSRWCSDDGIVSSIPVLPGSPEGSASESEDFELQLLRGSGSVEGDDFGRRSHGVEVSGNGKNYTPLDIESGLHVGDSRSKLENSEQSAAESAISASVVLKTLFYILVWYTFSTCLTLYNKTLLGDHLGKFPAPMLMNTVHFTMQAVLSKAIVHFQSRGGSESGARMSWRDYFIRVVPTALGTALDINLSNASLVFISVTFATMCKSASPIFLLLFAFAFRLETPSIKLVGVMFIISIGVLLTVAKETEFEFWGFVFVMLAAVMSGFRWSMTQILLQKEAFGLQNPITLMSYVAPVMAVATAILSLIMDPWKNLKKNGYFDNSKHIFRSSIILLIGGALAFCMVLTEYILVSATSAVTVTVAGIVKEAVTILVAVYYFHDQFTLLKGMGLFTIIVGVSLFNWYKYQKLKKGQSSEYAEKNPTSSNEAAKYVILDDMDFQDDDT